MIPAFVLICCITLINGYAIQSTGNQIQSTFGQQQPGMSMSTQFQADFNMQPNFQQTQNSQLHSQMMQQIFANYPELANQMQNGQDGQMGQTSRPDFFQQQSLSEMDPRFMSMQGNGFYGPQGQGEERLQFGGDEQMELQMGTPKKKSSKMYRSMKKWGYYLYVIWPLLKGWGLVSFG